MTHVYNAFKFRARSLDYLKPDLHGVDTKEIVNFVHESIFRMASIQINSQLIMMNAGHLGRNWCSKHLQIVFKWFRPSCFDKVPR